MPVHSSACQRAVLNKTPPGMTVERITSDAYDKKEEKESPA